jgi:predicted nucleotidyltransferase component of viral defense system
MLVRSVPLSSAVLKGGSNLRFFFGSIRYSEDMDLDVQNLEVHALRDIVMSILEADALGDSLSTYGIHQIVPPNLEHAKQTETVQRFKVHLLTGAGEDLFTKIEFSRRGITEDFLSEDVLKERLVRYRMAPMVVPHYSALSALRQKLIALKDRQQAEARDVFDIHTLQTQPEVMQHELKAEFSSLEREAITERIYIISFEEFRDMVLNFLNPEDRNSYDSEAVWDEMRLGVIDLLE